MKIFILSLLISTISLTATARVSCKDAAKPSWFESTGFQKSQLFADSAIQEKPIEMKVQINDWKTVQTEADREKANSKATFTIANVNLEGTVQARGQSRFNLFRTRALTFLAGGSDLKVVNRNGGFKDQPKLSSQDQNARVLVEYLIYKIHEIIFKEESVKTRLGIFTYVDSTGKVLDKGYGFFVEGKGQVSKRLHGSEVTSWEYKHDLPDSISGNIFRRMILDGDDGNMINNFIYYQSASSPEVVKRIPYDFDYTYLAPPQQLKLQDLEQQQADFRQWLEKSYELGTTGDHQYLKPAKGSKAQQAKALKAYREQILLSAKQMSQQADAILTTIPWEILPSDYKVTVKTWFEMAFKELQTFIEAHQE